MVLEGLYFDDLCEGMSWRTVGATLTEAEIIDFALKFDPQPFHIDTEAARTESIFGGLIASGFHTLALSFRLFMQSGVLRAASLGGPGMEDLRWLRPVHAGDTIRTIVTVHRMVPSRSKPDRGAVTWAFDVRNQRDETVMTARLTSLMTRRGS
ncbi:MAG: MaoC family dehydratase [Alphaproteobacteria bacterium]|nr:MAG: MaoC family dehydratase [Alphaproteobacteria bacterium]